MRTCACTSVKVVPQPSGSLSAASARKRRPASSSVETEDCRRCSTTAANMGGELAIEAGAPQDRQWATVGVEVATGGGERRDVGSLAIVILLEDLAAARYDRLWTDTSTG